jgi:hypothetical protein
MQPNLHWPGRTALHELNYTHDLSLVASRSHARIIVAGRLAFPTRQSRPTFGTWPWPALTTGLANFNIVVEKWDSSTNGGKRSGSKGKHGGAKGYTTARAGTSNTRAAAQDAASSIQDRVEGMPAADQAALLQTLTAGGAL